LKVSIVGAGNAGCFTALYYSWHAKDLEVELIHNPNNPPVTVGQGTIPGALELLHNTTRFNWHNNKVHATPKTGFLYEGWGKINYEVMHPFPAENMAMHFCPHEMQREILNSGRFKVIEDDVDPKDVDADFVIDARGGKPDDYIKLTSPVNSAILGKPKWNTLKIYILRLLPHLTDGHLLYLWIHPLLLLMVRLVTYTIMRLQIHGKQKKILGNFLT